MPSTFRIQFQTILVLSSVLVMVNGNEKRKTRDTFGIKCNIRPQDEKFALYLDDSRVVLSEYRLRMANYSRDPLRFDIGENYKPWRWYRTRTQHGRTLLMLSFNYDVLSMTILTIGVVTHDVPLLDSPSGCFGRLSETERVLKIRHLILDSFNAEKKTDTELEQEQHKSMTVYVCNEVVKDNEGYAEFVNECCNQVSQESVVCTDQVQDSWIALLYICISMVKVFLFLFSPLLLPNEIYSAAYVASEYVIKLQKELKLKMFITESTETSIRYKKRLTIEDISEWRRFRKDLEEQPMEEIIPIKIPELRVKVKGKRIIPENQPPTGLMRTFYDNLIRCKIKNIDPFSECCDRSVFASMEPQVKYKCTWHMFVQTLVKVLLMFLVPSAYYLRIYIYYQFEIQEIELRTQTAESLHLREKFNFYRSNLIQYLSPTHGIFISAYIFYFSIGAFIGFADEIVRDKIKAIVRAALQDMSNVQRTSVLQVLVGILLWPFKRCGLLAILLAPVYTAIVAPFCFIIFAIYCIPTVYLSYRIFFHTRKMITYTEEFEKPIKPVSKTKLKVKKAKAKMINIDTAVHLNAAEMHEHDDKLFPCTWGTGRFYSCRRAFVQFVVAMFLVCCLYAMVLIFVETVGLVVETGMFTMMGIIVNAGRTLRYVSMALLVFVYMHDCYNNVYESYLSFNKTVIEDVMDRVEDLKMVASLPSSMQENAGFTVKPVEALDEIPTVLSLEKKEPSWRIGHLLLFLDSCDTPRIPLNFFKKLCDIRIHGAPGPVYINLLRATGKFLIIVIFLFFVMIVVMAFGNAHQVSSTNQTLATLAGGFVPMLLKNILPRKQKKLNLKTLSFKGQIDEIIAEYKQNWPLYDLIFEPDEPSESGDSEKSSEGELEDGDVEPMLKTKFDTIHEGKEMGEKDKGEKDKGNDDDKEKDGKKERNIDTYIKNKDTRRGTIDASKPSQIGDSTKSNGNILSLETAKLLPRHSIVAGDYVDLFIDLSVAETEEPWNMYGSQDSMASATMLPQNELFSTMDNMNNGDFELPEIKVEMAD